MRYCEYLDSFSKLWDRIMAFLKLFLCQQQMLLIFIQLDYSSLQLWDRMQILQLVLCQQQLLLIFIQLPLICGTECRYRRWSYVSISCCLYSSSQIILLSSCGSEFRYCSWSYVTASLIILLSSCGKECRYCSWSCVSSRFCSYLSSLKGI